MGIDWEQNITNWFAWEGLERTYSFKSQLTEKEKKQFQQKKAHINSTTNAKCK